MQTFPQKKGAISYGASAQDHARERAREITARAQHHEDITSICGGLNINIGTLNKNTIPSMFLAGKKANALGHIVLLDPVGAGASRLRTDTANRLMREVRFDAVRGNISEIKTLCTGSGTTKGVDADAVDAVTEANLDDGVQRAAGASATAARR